MVDLVKIGGRNQQGQRVVDRQRQPDVGVLQEAGQHRPHPVDRKRARGRTEHDRGNRQEGVADDAFARMLTDRRRDIHRAIRVVHAVKTPEQSDVVHCAVGDVEREVEPEDHEQRSRRGLQTESGQEAEAPRFDPDEYGNKRHVEDEVRPECDEGERKIGYDMGPVLAITRMKRDPALDGCEHRHRDQNGSDHG